MRSRKKIFKSYLVGGLITFVISVLSLKVVCTQEMPPAFNHGQLDKALTTVDLFELNRFETVLKNLLSSSSSPSHYLYHFYLGEIYLRTALYYESKSQGGKALLETSEYLVNQARDQFKEVVRANGDFSQGYLYLAMAYAQKIRHVGYPTLLRYVKRVEENIEKALAKDPTNPRVYLIQGIQAMYKPVRHGGSVDEAIRLLQKSVELEPQFHEGYYWLARAYVQNSFKGRDEVKAQNCLLKALKLSPDDYFYKQGLTPDVQVPEYKEFEGAKGSGKKQQGED